MKRILVPTDFLPTAEKAFRFALELARKDERQGETDASNIGNRAFPDTIFVKSLTKNMAYVTKRPLQVIPEFK